MSKKKTKIYIVYSCDVWGECEAAYLEDGTLLHWWSNNDACWRGEYLEPIFEDWFEFPNDPNNKYLTLFEEYLAKEFPQEEEEYNDEDD